jgi:hypothetical protein
MMSVTVRLVTTVSLELRSSTFFMELRKIWGDHDQTMKLSTLNCQTCNGPETHSPSL